MKCSPLLLAFSLLVPCQGLLERSFEYVYEGGFQKFKIMFLTQNSPSSWAEESDSKAVKRNSLMFPFSLV